MGDRGNIKVGGVYLYSHWGGSGLREVLKTVLKRKKRWIDEPYLTRMIFCEMMNEEKAELLGETGFGISVNICDNENEILEVDCKNQTVNGISFEKFIGKKEVKKEICCMCQMKYEGYGNNAQPIMDGMCCDECNKLVIKRRLEELN